MLSDERIDEIAGPADYFDRRVFARAIEAEVRAQDEALIQQLVEALDTALLQKVLDTALLQNDWEVAMTDEKLRQARSAIALGRARLEGKP